MTHMPTLTHATERDVDLLLVEEFAASPDFVAWFARAAGCEAGVASRSSVLHSTRRMHSRREIDITVEVETPAGPLLLLVENKLDTVEQPKQAESYREEALALAGRYHAVRTVLVCPESYAAEHRPFAAAFDAVVPYQDVIGFLARRGNQVGGELGVRCLHRARLLEQAVDKHRRGYVQVVHPAKRAFATRYVDLLKVEAPDLIPGPSMLKEGGAESVTMIFGPRTLPDWPFLPQMRLVHQLREANANLCFYGWGDRFADLAGPMAGAVVGTGLRLVPSVNKRAGGRSGLMVVAATPKVDQFGDFDAQVDTIRAGISACVGLRSWLLAHREEVRAWANLVERLEGGQA